MNQRLEMVYERRFMDVDNIIFSSQNKQQQQTKEALISCDFI